MDTIAIDVLKLRLEEATTSRNNTANNIKRTERVLHDQKRELARFDTEIFELKRAIRKLGGRINVS